MEREQAENFFPVRVLATAAQSLGEEGVEVEFAPELIAEPARAPGTGTRKLQFIQAHLHGRRGAGGGGAVLGKERARAGLAVVLIEDVDGLLPGGALGVVDLAQIEDMALPDGVAAATAFDDGPRAMPLAVLFAGAAFEKDGGSVAPRWPAGRGSVATTRAWAGESGGLPGKPASAPPENSQIAPPVAEVGLT